MKKVEEFQTVQSIILLLWLGLTHFAQCGRKSTGLGGDHFSSFTLNFLLCRRGMRVKTPV